MKLIKLEIGKEKVFRSLYPGFKVQFNDPAKMRTDREEIFNPFCLVGLNGTGKSNVLEAIAAIFFHLECCVARFRPESFHSFREEESYPDDFLLDYLIQRKNGKTNPENFDWVSIRKRAGKAPEMFVKPFTPDEAPFRKISLIPGEENGFPRAAEGKIYLPDIIVAYSSGENEILSIPFLKSRLINFDKYTEDYRKKYRYEEPENSLIYIDNGMSQAVLLACLLYEDTDTTFAFLKKELGLMDIVSFRMNINVQTLKYVENGKSHAAPVTDHIQDTLERLRACATCSYEQSLEISPDNPEGLQSILTLDFLVGKETRKAFRSLFKTAFKCFRFFQVLYELNDNFLSTEAKQEVYTSKGVHTQGKIPDAGPGQDVFHFLDFMILKACGGHAGQKELLLREFSDGEHQLLHTMGMCLMLKEERCLMLLDEPETHFNPEWRSKFIQTLHQGLKAGGGSDLLKEIIITSHSAFIISDCKPDKVIVFERDSQGIVRARKALEMGYRTYGTSVNLLTNRIFKEKHTIGKYAFDTIIKYRKMLENGMPLEHIIDQINEEIGDSIEKVLLIKEFTRKC